MRTQTGGGPRLKTLFPVLCALAFLPPRGRAQTLIEVTNTASDTSAGSLGAALNAATPNTIIIFAPFISPVITPAASYTNVIPLTLDANQETVIFNGAAGMSVNSGGLLNLNGLTASGITVNSGGTLSTSFSSIGGLTLAGGTYQTRDNSYTSDILLSGGGTVDVFGSNPTISGLNGTGGLTVVDSSVGGGGVLIMNAVNAAGLSDPNTYSGGTQINSGTLQLGISGALPAGSNLTTLAPTISAPAGGIFNLNGFSQTLGTVINGGTIKTGLGTLTATNYSGGGTLSVALQSGLTNLVVNNAATLSGTLAVTGHPALGAYTIVTAGTLSGTFASTALPFGVTDTLTCSALAGTCLVDILSDSPFSFAGQSSNQAAIGNVMNVASYNATGDLASVISQLSAMPAVQANAALDQIGPISYAALSGMSFAGAGVQSAAVNQRLTGLQASRANSDGARFASFNAGGSYPGTLVAELPGDTSAAYTDADRLFDPNSRWGFFVAGLGTFDRLDPIAGNSGAQPGYSVNATGETFGADYRFNDHFAAGVSAGYVNSFAEISGVGGTVYGQSARLGTYATVYDDTFHGNLYLGGAHDFYDTSRGIPAFSRVATANPSGQEFNMDVLGGWDVKTRHAVVSPFLGLAYDRMMLGSFTESGAGALDLAVSPQTAESLRSSLGIKVSRQFKTDWADFTPFASAGWQHEFESQSRALGAQLASGGTGAFTVMTADVARESALLGAGVNMDWTPGFSTRLAYESTMSFDFHANTFDGSLRWRF